MISAVCTDGAPAMIGCKSGLRGLSKSDAPHIAFTHCVLHRYTLVSKTLSSLLADVLKIVVETVNFVRGRALNHRIFMQLCEEMESEFNLSQSQLESKLIFIMHTRPPNGFHSSTVTQSASRELLNMPTLTRAEIIGLTPE